MLQKKYFQDPQQIMLSKNVTYVHLLHKDSFTVSIIENNLVIIAIQKWNHVSLKKIKPFNNFVNYNNYMNLDNL